MDQTGRTTRSGLVSIRSLVAAGLLLVAVAGCGSGSRPSFPLPSGALPIPTDPNLLSAEGTGILCTPDAIVPPVEGYLRGDPTDAAWPVWLEATDGHRQYILWPVGFSVRFTPEPELLDERGTLALTDVVHVELQVGWSPDLGTKDHPYVAAGIVGSGCYIHRP